MAKILLLSCLFGLSYTLLLARPLKQFTILNNLQLTEDSSAINRYKKAFIKEINPTSWQQRLLLAVSEDSVGSQKLLVLKNGHFSNTIRIKEGNYIVYKTYYGTAKFSIDTVFLSFYKGSEPPNIYPILVKEISGGYVIQKYKDGSRSFLRIHKNSFR